MSQAGCELFSMYVWCMRVVLLLVVHYHVLFTPAPPSLGPKPRALPRPAQHRAALLPSALLCCRDTRLGLGGRGGCSRPSLQMNLSLGVRMRHRPGQGSPIQQTGTVQAETWEVCFCMPRVETGCGLVPHLPIIFDMCQCNGSGMCCVCV